MPDASSCDIDSPLEISIASEIDVTLVQVQVRLRAEQWGFSHVEQFEIATAATELATNILKYGVRGTIVFGRIDEASIKLVATDVGGGIEDAARAVEDGFSTDYDGYGTWRLPRRSLGRGLGAITRLMDELNISRADGGGALITATKRMRGK